ncbi:MAG: SpoIIE family protein phosphatase [Archangiaceae bacterium]|nr:SpoIIE family protein phosphatase [Archangiaceae bacterium]
MALLTSPTDALVAGAPEPYLQALRSYRLGMAGLHTRASLALGQALTALEPHQGFRAQALALAGLVSRADCDWELASRQLADAAERRQASAPQAARVHLALAVEALAAAGLISEAQRLIEAWPARAPAGAEPGTDLASAVVHLVRGNFAEGVQLCGAVLRSDPASPWATLLELEGKLELGRGPEVEAGAQQLLGQREQAGELDELYVRTAVLVARQAVEALWAPGAAPGPAEQARAERAVDRLLGCTPPFERYRAHAFALQAQLLELRRPGAGATKLKAALALLEGSHTLLDQGTLIARQAAFHAGRGQLTTRPLIARGRDLLGRIGADARSQALAQVEGSPEVSNSLFATNSMMGRSMMQASLGGDDVELQAVFKVNEAISSVLDLNELLQRVLNEVVKLLKAERGALLRRYSDGRIECVVARGLVPDKVKEGTDEISFSVVREVERTGLVTLTDNAQVDERFRGKASVMAGDIRSLMCAPLKTQKELYGFIYLDSTLRSRIFKESHRELLQVFATQAAVAIENALTFGEVEDLNQNLEARVEDRTAALKAANLELAAKIDELTNTRLKLLEAEKEAVEKEMQIARKIQEGILPTRELQQHPGLKLIGKVEPATQVGGDFWAVMPLAEQRTLLLIGDVTGHGVGPGMLTTVAKTCCDTVVRDKGQVELKGMLSVLSDVLFEASRGELTMTAFALLVDPREKKLHYANCGHVLPLFFDSASGLPKLSALVGPGPVLGRARGTTFDSRSRAYLPRDRVLLYTDGLTECSDPQGNELGDKKLQRAAMAAATQPLEQQLKAIFDTAYAHYAGHPRDDDVTAVLLELTELEA